jgi:hypothetical protein
VAVGALVKDFFFMPGSFLALLRIRAAISLPDQDGCFARRIAARPATWGVAIEVPGQAVYFDSLLEPVLGRAGPATGGCARSPGNARS